MVLFPINHLILIIVALLGFILPNSGDQPGQVILISSRHEGNRKLYTSNPSGGEPELFLDLTAYGWLDIAALSPDGSKLAFVVYKTETEIALYVLDLATNEAVEVRSGGKEIGDISWSADSLHLFYLSNGINGQFGSISGYDTATNTDEVVNWEAAAAEVVTFDLINSMELSPDGQKVLLGVISLPPDAFSHFVVINADGSDPQLLPVDNPGLTFAWNSTSEVFYFTCINKYGDAPDLCEFDLSTQQVQILLSIQDIQVFVGERDYAILAIEVANSEILLKFAGDSSVYIYNLQTQAMSKALDNPDYDVSVIGWIRLPEANPDENH